MEQKSTKITEPARLAALRAPKLSDSPPDPEFDRVTRLTSRLLHVPVARVLLVDAPRQRSKTARGLPEPPADKCQTPLSHAFCQHVVATSAPLVVNDAREQPLLHDNLAVPDPGLVAYLGCPLRAPDGHVLGALCAIDTNPRSWTASDIELLTDLAALVPAEIARRQAIEDAAQARAALLKAQEQAAVDNRLHLLADSMPQIIWTSTPDGKLQYCNRHWFDYSGMTFDQTMSSGCSAIMHPDDVQASCDRRKRAFERGEAYESEYRFKRASDGEYRWHLGRTIPVKDQAGRIMQWLGTCTDIHDQKASQVALTQSNEHLEKLVQQRTAELVREHRFLEAVLENVADGIIACDAHGKLKLDNRAMRESQNVLEETLAPEQWASHYSLYCADGVTPMTVEQIPLLRALRGEQVQAAEYVVASPVDGKRRRMVANGSAFYDADGKKLGAVIARHDVTERSAAQERFRVLFEHSSEAHFLLQDGRILDCNDAAIKLIGCSDKDQLCQMHPADFSPEFQPDGRRSAEARREIDLSVQTSGFKRFEWVLRHTDGHDVPVEVSLTPTTIEGRFAIISVCHDLTQRKQDEQALAQAKRFAESIAEYSACNIYIRDLRDETLQYVNQLTAESLGYPREELIGKGIDFTRQIFHPDDFPLLLAAREKIRTYADGQVLEYSARLRHADGTWRTMWNRQVVFQRDESGQPTQIMGIALDITELLRVQEELKIAKEAAEAATRAKSEFLTNMSHEIRTPMTAIMGFAKLLQDPNQSPGQRKEYLQIVKRNGRHLMKVLNDILDVSRLDAGKLSLEEIECDPSKIFAEVCTLMRPLALEKGLAFGIEENGALPDKIVTDPTRLTQVLLNLVGNAIKFTQAGSVRITVSCEREHAKRRLRIDVSDTGMGIDARQQANLFAPFGQADSSMHRRFGGSGLGLAISKRLAGMMGGELSMVSELGRGSTFTLLLNIADPRAPEKHAAPPPPIPANVCTPHSTLGGRILVAEDTVDTRRLVTPYLEQAGATVEGVSNGLLALDAVAAAARDGQPFDAVLMDMQMPELDGYCATARLRQMGFTQLPIIAFTAHATQEERDKTIRAGCSDYVAKPIDLDNLMEVVGRQMSTGAKTASAKSTQPLRSTKSRDTVIGQLIDEYIAGLKPQVADILAALDAGDLAKLKLKVHQLRGSGGSYGFPEISQQAQKAELAIAAQQPIDNIAREVHALFDLIHRIEGYDEPAHERQIARPLDIPCSVSSSTR